MISENVEPAMHETALTLTVQWSTWISSNVKIIDKDSHLVALIPNGEQMMILYTIAVQVLSGIPIRIIILKSRKIGASTIIMAWMFMMTIQRPNRRTLVSAHDADTSSELFRMVQVAKDELPKASRLPTKYSTRKEIEYESPHRSIYDVQTAGKLYLGTGATIHAYHGSEVAKYANDTTTLLSVLSAVPDGPGTAVFLESTANGVGGEFHERWERAMEHRTARPNDPSGYIPLFFPWFEHVEYRTTVPEDYEWGQLDADERWLKDHVRVDDEQLYWRRVTIRDKCGGDVNKFRQENPATQEEAFQSSGRPGILPEIVRRHQQTARTGKRYRLFWDGKGGVTAKAGEYEDPYWEVFHEPDPGKDYAAGADVARGELSDPTNSDSADSSAGTILNRPDLRTDAVFRGRVPTDQFGEEMLKAAIWYNQAWLGIEITGGYGVPALKVAMRSGYPNIYQRQGRDNAVEETESPLYGWDTTTAMRPMLYEDWIAACRPDERGQWDGRITVLSSVLAAEEATTIIDKTGKRTHKTGCHDDVLFSAMIAYQMHQRCPRNVPATQFRANETDERHSRGVHHGEIDRLDDMFGDSDGLETY